MRKEPIRVYEYSSFIPKDCGYSNDLLESLISFHSDKEFFPYYSLIKNGVRFKNYVGVLQVGNEVIEVLPKIDKKQDDKDMWQSVLIDMLRQSGTIKTDVPTSAGLRLKSNNLLELYMSLFLSECEFLLNRGLIKRYRKEEGNQMVLKGSMLFPKQITHNSVHQERFYVRYTTYDQEHVFNQILLKTIHLIRRISNDVNLKGRVSSLVIRFPELSDLKLSDSTFSNIKFDRKNIEYKYAIDIARLLLLNYHPDIRSGSEYILALMFDMNLLWEKWVLKQMQKLASNKLEIDGQISKDFWKSEHGSTKSLRPDIVLKTRKHRIILDTKWKIPKDLSPDDSDLKQMFSYNKRFDSDLSILLYPGSEQGYMGNYFRSEHGRCEVRFVDVIVNGELSSISIHHLLEAID